MKWREAYQCKQCGQILKHKQDQYCKGCGAEIAFANSTSIISPPRMFATENLQPVIIRRKWFRLEVKPSAIPLGLVQGKPPPWD